MMNYEEPAKKFYWNWLYDYFADGEVIKAANEEASEKRFDAIVKYFDYSSRKAKFC